MKKSNLKRWLSVLLSAMVIVGTIKVPVFAKAADTSYDPAIAQDYSGESLLETSDQPGDEPDETAYSETDGKSAWELEDETEVLTDGTVDESTASTALDAAETGTTENEAAPAPGELSDPDWEETDPYTSDSETAVEEGTDLDNQVTEEQESSNSDNPVTENQESNNFDNQVTEEQESSNSDNQVTEYQESNNFDNQVTEEQESNIFDNQMTEEQKETDYNNQVWDEEADYIDQPVENEENTNSSSELPEETDDSSVSDSVLLDNNSSNEINPDEADSEEEISDVLILEESDSEEVGRRGTDTEYYSDETEFPYVDDFGNQGQTDIPNSITEENQEEAVSDEAYNYSETSGICGEGLTWMIDSEGTVTITGTGEIQKTSWPSDMKKVIIENGVTGIGEFAFQDPNDMEEVVIPSTVTSIGRFAFMCCDDLKRVDIPSGVTVIREGAFGGCSGLISVSIPSGVTSIEDQAFRGCWRLKEVILPPNLTTIGKEAFSYCSALTSLRIPGSVTSMSGAFGGCEGLTTVEISEGVTSVGGFSGCSSLTSITIPEGVTSIEDSAFYGCSSLTSITIPEGVTSIEDSAFSDCGSLTDISIPGSLTSIGKSAFFRCFNLQNVQYGGTKEEWTRVTVQDGNNALLNALDIVEKPSPDEIVESGVCGDNLTWELNGEGTLTISGTGEMTSSPWQDNRSGYDEDIKSVIIQEGVTSICDGAFLRLDELVNVTIPSSVTSIGEFAFYRSGNGTGLVSIVIPEGVTSIGQQAFDGCQKLTGVTIPSTMTEIGIDAFMGCSSLTNVDIQMNEHGMSIGKSAFECCSSLTNIIIPSGVTSIGSQAFDMCSSLRTVTLPKSIKNIGYCIFLDWNNVDSNLQTVKYAGTEADWASVVVDDNNNGLTHALCFTNADAVDVSGAWTVTFDKPAGYTYTGKAIEPQVTVTEGTKVLELGVDYSVSYKNNKEIGLGAVVIVPSTPGYDEWIEETFVIKDTCTVTFDANGGGFLFNEYGNEIEFHIGTGEFERGELMIKGDVDNVRIDNDRHSGSYYYAVNEDIHKVCVGWSLTRNGSPLDEEYKVYSDVTVYAVWEEVYSVVLYGNGGNFSQPYDVTCSDWIYNRYHPVNGGMRLYAHKGEYIPLPKRHNYGIYEIRNDDDTMVFAGWGLSKNGTNVAGYNSLDGKWNEYHMGDDVPLYYKPTGDCTLYALWKPYIDIEFNANGGYFHIHLWGTSEEYQPSNTEKFAVETPQDGKFGYCLGCFSDLGKTGELGKITPDRQIFVGDCTYSMLWDSYIQLINDKAIFVGWSTSKTGTPIIDYDSFSPTKKCTLYAVWKKPVNKISLGKTSLTVTQGSTASLAATVSPTDASLKTVTWKSSNTKVAKVDQNGKVTPVGTGSATITAIAKDGSGVKASCKVTVVRRSVAKATVTGIKSKVYTGKVITQIPVVKYGKTTLKKGTDYKLTYKNNKNAGTATITITGIGTYTGSVSKSFKIGKAAQKISVKTSSSSIVAGKRATVSITGAKGKKSFTSSNTAIATVNKTTGVVTARKAGTVKITARSAATANYNAASKVVTIKVIPPTPQSLAASNQVKGLKLTWKKVTVGSGYEIQYSLNRNFSGVKKILVNKNATVNKVLTGLVKGKTYYFRIRTYKTVGKTKYYSVWSATKTVKVTK